MSTKIYNGYRIATTSMLELRDKLKEELRPKIEKVKERLVIKEVAAKYHYTLDRRRLGLEEGETDPSKAMTEVIWSFEEEVREAVKSPYRSHLDFKCAVGIIPVTTKLTLAMSFFGREDYRKTWERMPWVSDYHYQDQTDRPDKISARAWRQRRDDWEKAIGPSYRPSDHCFELQICDGEIFMLFYGGKLKKRVAAAAEPLTRRLDRFVLDVALKDRVPKETKEISEIMRIRRETREWLQNEDDGKKFYQAKMTEFVSKTQQRYL